LEAGVNLKKLIGNESITFYVSPFLRTRQSYDLISKNFDQNKHMMIEDPRIREQERGNYQKFYLENPEFQKKCVEERHEIGSFFYRFEGGESVADVYDRCSSFLETLFRFENIGRNYTDNKVLICHGGFMRLFLMRYYRWKISKFEVMENPNNCEMWILERNEDNGRYNLISDVKFH